MVTRLVVAAAAAVVLHTDYATGEMTLFADLGWTNHDSADTLAAGTICKDLRLSGHLDRLPVRWTIETMIPRGGGQWTPDPKRRKTGVLVACP